MEAEVDKILNPIFAFGIDWEEFRDKSDKDHEVSTFAGKIKSDLKAEVKQAILTLIAEAEKKAVGQQRYKDIGIAEVFYADGKEFLIKELSKEQEQEPLGNPDKGYGGIIQCQNRSKNECR
jgi:hypothetical protein